MYLLYKDDFKEARSNVSKDNFNIKKSRNETKWWFHFVTFCGTVEEREMRWPYENKVL